MDTLPAVTAINLATSIGAANSSAFGFPVTATASASLFDSGSTVVDLSNLGQLLSAVATFGSNIAALAPGSSNSGLGQNFGTDSNSLAAEAQYFVDAFNGLQNGLNGINAASRFSTGATLASQVATTFNTLATGTYDNGNSGLTTLAQIGITFQPPAVAGNGGTLSIDISALQSAFQSDATGSFALLSQAADALGGLAANYTDQTSRLATVASNQNQVAAIQQALFTNLLATDSGIFGTNTGIGTGSLNLGLNTLLVLQAAQEDGATASSLAQQISAINQFNLVSSLLG